MFVPVINTAMIIGNRQRDLPAVSPAHITRGNCVQKIFFLNNGALQNYTEKIKRRHASEQFF
jgi:hypothetical protein